jgi:hypothetical protein
MTWKDRETLPANFVRKLFLSSDFLICRICEHVAHNHRRSGDAVEQLVEWKRLEDELRLTK